MNWEDDGFLIAKKKFRENANIIEVFTHSFGKMSGIVYGGNSRKIRNYLQIGNKIFVFHNSKGDNKIGYFKTELVEAISPKYFADKKKTSAILSITSLLSKLLPENQSNTKIYDSLVELISNFDMDNWLILYVYWELNLIKELGFDTDLSRFKNKTLEDSDIVKITVDNIKFQIPKFLITSKIPNIISNNLLSKSLIFTRSIFLNKFFLPNNIMFPKPRILLENYFN